MCVLQLQYSFILSLIKFSLTSSPPRCQNTASSFLSTTSVGSNQACCSPCSLHAMPHCLALCPDQYTSCHKKPSHHQLPCKRALLSFLWQKTRGLKVLLLMIWYKTVFRLVKQGCIPESKFSFALQKPSRSAVSYGLLHIISSLGMVHRKRPESCPGLWHRGEHGPMQSFHNFLL